MKVWICSKGSYSDYGVTAVYSDETLAKRTSQAYGWNDPVEMEVDPETPSEVRSGCSFFGVVMMNDGTYYHTYLTEPNSWTSEDRPYDRVSGPSGQAGPGCAYFCWARDEAHAIKIANERRIMRLAVGEAQS